MSALSIFERKLGSDHPNVAHALTSLAEIHRVRGDRDTAAAMYERALVIREKALGAEHVEVTVPLLGLAEIALSNGRPGEAITPAERALAIRERGGEQPRDVAAARYTLARALWHGNVDRSRALELARRASEAYRAIPDASGALAEVDVWLARRRTLD